MGIHLTKFFFHYIGVQVVCEQLYAPKLLDEEMLEDDHLNHYKILNWGNMSQKGVKKLMISDDPLKNLSNETLLKLLEAI